LLTQLLAMQAGMGSETLQQDKEPFALKQNLIECLDDSSPKKRDSVQQVASASPKTLDLSSYHLKDKKMIHVVGLLKGSGCEVLNLSNNQFKNDGVQMLFDDLPPSVKAIDLSYNKLTPTLGIGWIMDCLEKTKGLKFLDISYNCTTLPSNVGEAIGEALEKNPSLQTLKLRGMGLNYESFHFIRKGLRHNTNLTYLDISENPMDGILLLEDLIQENTSLKHIEAEGCGINREDFIDILLTLNENQTFEYLGFDKNPKVPDEELKLWAPKIEQDLGFKVDLERHTLARISPLKKPVPREYWVYSIKKDKPSISEKM
ncbi:hypothetical protein, partial [Candidatus Paracaedibacter symbiosus]|uniref:hypothetical protein n=1 Tax=Candidatus Paracaedibacter symbiosus TaxID=244582 RepID=UPI0012EB3EB0